MFIILGDISFEMLPEGIICKRKLTPAEARGKINQTQGPITGCFEFGSVPCARRERNFQDILKGLAELHDIEIDPRIFFSNISVGQDGKGDDTPISGFPIPTQLARLTPARPVIVISYAFRMFDRSADEDESLDGLISRLRVCPYTLAFHMLECVEAEGQG